mmetsp:Transcript_15181/g.33042  ORF Transcript_15181/g.33042 Transcript_15181/m.33042 type:complete len:150 (-) Transcript_15181:1243-1692(-)
MPFPSIISAIVSSHPTVILGLFLLGLYTLFSDLQQTNFSSTTRPNSAVVAVPESSANIRAMHIDQEATRSKIRGVNVPIAGLNAVSAKWTDENNVDMSSFDYRTFWDKAWDSALATNQTLSRIQKKGSEVTSSNGTIPSNETMPKGIHL